MLLCNRTLEVGAQMAILMNPQESIRSIQMLWCRIDYRLTGEHPFVATHFPDGTHYGSLPQGTEAYFDLADRCGYASVKLRELEIVWRYCLEHEIAHALIGEVVFNGPSRVIWGLAHGRHAPAVEILAEEELAISLQAFARADILPGSSAPGFNWFKVRDRFLELCNGDA